MVLKHFSPSDWLTFAYFIFDSRFIDKAMRDTIIPSNFPFGKQHKKNISFHSVTVNIVLFLFSAMWLRSWKEKALIYLFSGWSVMPQIKQLYLLWTYRPPTMDYKHKWSTCVSAACITVNLQGWGEHQVQKDNWKVLEEEEEKKENEDLKRSFICLWKAQYKHVALIVRSSRHTKKPLNRISSPCFMCTFVFIFLLYKAKMPYNGFR